MSSVDPSRAVLNALAIIESFDGDHQTQSLAEISRRLAIPKPTALRHLKALECRGYVLLDRDRQRYAIGSRLLTVGQRHFERFDPLAAARPIVAELATASGETAHYGILEGNEVVYLEIAESPQRLRAYVQRGDRLPAHAVAAGKAILANSPPQAVERFLSGHLAKLTAASITDAAGLRHELQLTRARGYGLNVGEWVDEVAGVSAPVFASGRGVLGAIGVAGPRSRLSDKLAETGGLVRRFAGRLSALMGATAEGQLEGTQQPGRVE